MGVRKTFGASEAIIVRIMLMDITRLVILSLAIGPPASWFLVRRWLQDFYYRIDLSPDIFLLSTILILLVSLFTILYHALRSSRLNPVTALQYE
ncbi:MAG: FtsX-like permease family protein [Bacteroidales bacterium]|nr:FtsX-like permease family protein [Bacteroidales bacterium]